MRFRFHRDRTFPTGGAGEGVSSVDRGGTFSGEYTNRLRKLSDMVADPDPSEGTASNLKTTAESGIFVQKLNEARNGTGHASGSLALAVTCRSWSGH